MDVVRVELVAGGLALTEPDQSGAVIRLWSETEAWIHSQRTVHTLHSRTILVEQYEEYACHNDHRCENERVEPQKEQSGLT